MMDGRDGNARMYLSARGEYAEKMSRYFDRLKSDESVKGGPKAGQQILHLLNRLEGLPSPAREMEFVRGCTGLAIRRNGLRLVV